MSNEFNLEQETKFHEKKFLDYCENVGIEKSCHIPRDLGHDLSIMLEIVQDSYESKSLFPEEA